MLQEKTHARRRRELWHSVVGVTFWVVFALLWVILFVEGKVTLVGVEASLISGISFAAGTLVLTAAWIRHNILISRRKGPRTRVATAIPAIDRDRLGRPVEWNVAGGPLGALEGRSLVVEIDGGGKRYSECAP